MSTYDAALESMTRDQLLALASHQGEQITRLVCERVACAEHEARIAELEEIVRQQNKRLRKGAA